MDTRQYFFHCLDLVTRATQLCSVSHLPGMFYDNDTDTKTSKAKYTSTFQERS